MSPLEALRAGAEELKVILDPAGFLLFESVSGKGSGGEYASGEFRRGNRRLELHVRQSLGLVSYHVGAMSLSHEDFTRAVRARTGGLETAEYPGFSTDIREAFRHLRVDLSRFGRAFVEEPDEAFADLVRWVQQHPKPSGFSALG